MLRTDWLDSARQYLQEVVGELPEKVPLPSKTLPLHLRDSYELVGIRLLGLELLLAVSRNEAAVSPAHSRKHLSLLTNAFNRPAVLVAALPAWARHRFIKEQIAFVTPGRQLYLPMVGLEFRNRAAQNRHHLVRTSEGPRQLLPSEQQILIFILLRDESEFAASSIASALSTSAMTVSRAFKQFEHLGIATRIQAGRSRPLQLHLTRAEIWDATSLMFANPIRKVHVLPVPELPFLSAGVSALSERTNLAPDTYSVWATAQPTADDWQDSAGINPLPAAAPEANNSVLQIWSYSPEPLALDSRVDPLSLYVSLRDVVDERVQMALEEYMEVIPWWSP